MEITSEQVIKFLKANLGNYDAGTRLNVELRHNEDETSYQWIVSYRKGEKNDQIAMASGLYSINEALHNAAIELMYRGIGQ